MRGGVARHCARRPGRLFRARRRAALRRRPSRSTTRRPRRPTTAVPWSTTSTLDAVLVFSSGTTGLPKAVRHTHRTLGHAVEHWIAALGLTDRDRFQIATPPVHILGLLNIVTAVAAGARVRLHPRFDLDASLRAIAEERLTLEMAVAPIALGMANHPRLEDFDLSSLRYIMWGATPVAEEVAAHGHPAFRRALAARVRNERGTGASPPTRCRPRPVAARQRRPGRARACRCGSPIPRPARCSTAGATGEIEVLSPSAMAGYLPASETVAAFHDGWYRTGDIGWLEPEGWLHITDRLKEMIKVRGFQVAPAEIEAVLHADARVRDCAVFGSRRSRRSARRSSPPSPRSTARRSTRRGAAGRSGRAARRATSASATSCSSTRSRGCRRARRCAGNSRTSGSPVIGDQRAESVLHAHRGPGLLVAPSP